MSHQKSGRLNRRMKPEERLMHLSTSVNDACNDFFKDRDMPCGTMKEVIGESMKRSLKKKKTQVLK